MAISFRNVDVAADQPVEVWPYEALVSMIERGGLAEWRRLSAAVGRDPWGRVARSIEDYARYAEPSGAVDLLRRAIGRAREGARREEEAEVAREVRSLVAASALGREEFASAIGTSASRLSTYCTGSVTPSAALLVRMRRVVDRRRASERRPGS